MEFLKKRPKTRNLISRYFFLLGKPYFWGSITMKGGPKSHYKWCLVKQRRTFRTLNWRRKGKALPPAELKPMTSWSWYLFYCWSTTTALKQREVKLMDAGTSSVSPIGPNSPQESMNSDGGQLSTLALLTHLTRVCYLRQLVIKCAPPKKKNSLRAWPSWVCLVSVHSGKNSVWAAIPSGETKKPARVV